MRDRAVNWEAYRELPWYSIPMWQYIPAVFRRWWVLRLGVVPP